MEHLAIHSIAVSGVSGGTYKVAYFASVDNTVYAYDVDSGTLLWSKNYNGNKAISHNKTRDLNRTD